MLFEIGMGIDFLFLAYYDWKHNKIPGWTSAAFWFFSGVGVWEGMVTSDFLVTASVIFGMFMFINELAVKRKGIEFMGWGDVLILPIIIAIIIHANTGMYNRVLAGLLAIVSLYAMKRLGKSSFLPVFVLPYLSIFIRLP